MEANPEKYRDIIAELGDKARLVAVSKTKPVEDIRALYDLGQRDFGENYVQELVDKQAQLPADIRWHFIGHLQSNKVKYIAPFVYLIHGVDSLKLLKEIDRQALRNDRVIGCLLQVHIAREETKFGLDAQELASLLENRTAAGLPETLKNIRVRGLMGMASFSDDPGKISEEFRVLRSLFDTCFRTSGDSNRLPALDQAVPGRSIATGAPDDKAPILSMGMSSDYKIAVQEGSNMVRIGSLLFGARSYPPQA